LHRGQQQKQWENRTARRRGEAEKGERRTERTVRRVAKRRGEKREPEKQKNHHGEHGSVADQAGVQGGDAQRGGECSEDQGRWPLTRSLGIARCTTPNWAAGGGVHVHGLWFQFFGALLGFVFDSLDIEL